MNPPICKDCRWCLGVVWSSNMYIHTDHSCRSPELGYNLVTGVNITKACEDVRKDPNMCGHDGKWHVQKGQTNDGLAHSDAG